MILRPRVLLIAVGTGLFWLAFLLAPLLLLAGWRLGHGGLAASGAVMLLACFAVYRLEQRHANRLRAWAGRE